jgi:hypothetical protein
MLTITIKVNAPSGQAIGVKEQISMALEKFGDVRVVNIEDDIEKSGEQVGLFEKGRERK